MASFPNGVTPGLQLKYFVLTPTKDDPYGEASRQAVLVYANAIATLNPNLSHDLGYWVKKICDRLEVPNDN